MLESVSEALAADTGGQGRVEVDRADSSGQTLFAWYPRIDASDTGYVQAAVKIESGAKSALDPNKARVVSPYIDDDIDTLDLSMMGVTTIHAERTFWDKVVIAHGLRNWFDRRGELRQDGQRVSRHHYDLHSLVGTEVGISALADLALGSDCIEHARTFFDRPDYNLVNAVAGSFSLRPAGDMINRLSQDYENTQAMIFGEAPEFKDILNSIGQIEGALNSG